MRRLIQVFVMGWIVLTLAGVGMAEEASMPMSGTDAPMFVRAEEMKWERMFPEFGAGSPEIVILRIDPKTQATQLMIRAPKGFHVPKHWHSANETHTVLSGRFIMECNGKHEELGPGSFNYTPGKMIHEAWISPDADVLVLGPRDRLEDGAQLGRLHDVTVAKGHGAILHKGARCGDEHGKCVAHREAAAAVAATVVALAHRLGHLLHQWRWQGRRLM